MESNRFIPHFVEPIKHAVFWTVVPVHIVDGIDIICLANIPAIKVHSVTLFCLGTAKTPHLARSREAWKV
jgi:hypothetical protein